MKLRNFKLLRGYEKKGNEPGMVWAPYVPMMTEPEILTNNPCSEIPLGMMSSRYANRMVDRRYANRMVDRRFYQEVEVMSRRYEGVPIVEERNTDN